MCARVRPHVRTYAYVRVSAAVGSNLLHALCLLLLLLLHHHHCVTLPGNLFHILSPPPSHPHHHRYATVLQPQAFWVARVRIYKLKHHEHELHITSTRGSNFVFSRRRRARFSFFSFFRRSRARFFTVASPSMLFLVCFCIRSKIKKDLFKFLNSDFVVCLRVMFFPQVRQGNHQLLRC